MGVRANMNGGSRRNLWLFIGVCYFVVPAVLVAIYGPQLAGAYKDWAVPPPDLTRFISHTYIFSFSFVLGVVPVVLAWFSARKNELSKSIWYAATLVVAGAQLLWAYLVWLGLWLPMSVLNSVVG